MSEFFYNIYNNFDIGVEFGNRNFETNNLEDENGNKWTMDIVDNYTPINLDFSGFFCWKTNI